MVRYSGCVIVFILGYNCVYKNKKIMMMMAYKISTKS